MGKGAEWHNTQFCGLRSIRATRQGRWKPITKGRKNNTPATPTLTQAGVNTTSISSSRRDAITTSFRAVSSRPDAGQGKTVHRFVDTLITASPEFFKDKTSREIRAYFAYALKFLEDRQRPDTFLSAVVHMDEKTPHLHLCFVPLTPDGRLSAKEIIGNRKNLVRWQDEFWQHMVKQYPELERGESASQTGREHIPPRIFKEMTQLTKQKEQLDALLVGITPFNGKSRAAEISKVLDSYIPNVARMKDQLRKYNVAFTKTAAENEKLKEKNKTLSASLDKAKEGSVLKRLEDAKLRQDYEAALKTLDSIPPEVIRFYENRTQEPVVHHDK